MSTHVDVAIIGAGVFGAWSAYWLRKAGLRVVLLDAYGSANSRSSSGGETRITRMAYGDDELYSRWALESLPEWLDLERRSRQKLFHQTGVLTFSDDKTEWVRKSIGVIQRIGGRCEHVSAANLSRRFPQIAFKPRESAVFEPHSGSLFARRALQLLVDELVSASVTYRQASISRIEKAGVRTSDGDLISAASYVFACGPWLPKLFPEVLGDQIRPVRAEVFFLGIPNGSSQFDPPKMPTWIFMGNEHWDAYGMPNLENRGFKLAVDLLQQPADPDTMDRQTTAPFVAQMREFVRDRFPALANAPIIEARVCQYENTLNHHYIIDRHPERDDVWLVGGGSGHGFKNGPAVGKYVAGLITGSTNFEPVLQLSHR